MGPDARRSMGAMNAHAAIDTMKYVTQPMLEAAGRR
jgi:hypothetical protein